ncbi:thioredoxin family protein [Oxalobacteraceae bacterium A2-2]
MTAQITTVNDANFEAEVAHSEVPVLIDFWAPWCGPCMALMPTLQALAPMYEGSLKIAKVNIDECPELADRFNVRGIPYMILTRHGDAVATLHDRSRTRLASEIDAFLDQDGEA